MPSIGGEANRTGGPLPNLEGRLTPGSAGLEPAAPAGPRPTFSKEDLSHITPAPDGDDALTAAGIDAAEAAGLRDALKRGLLTPEELQRTRGLTDEEMVALRQPARAAPKVNAEARLKELAALRKSDPKLYWSDKIQAEELALIAGEADAARPEIEAEAEGGESEAGDDELAQVQARLKEIASARKADRKSYTTDVEAEEQALLERADLLEAGAGDMAPEIIERWRVTGGLKVNMDKAVEAASRAGEEFDGLAAIIDNDLPKEASVAIVDALRLDWEPVRGGDAVRAQIADKRVDDILATMSKPARDAAETALSKLTKAQAAALVDVLAPARG